MNVLRDLVKPIGVDSFFTDYFRNKPYACPSTATVFRRLVCWDLLEEIAKSGHDECWLPKDGKLPAEAELCTGRLQFEQMIDGYSKGRTILVRHAEKAHPFLREIAQDFHQILGVPIDVQLYYTPAGEAGLDWHFDYEEVFVIQSLGQKVFYLRKDPPSEVGCGETLQCLLAAGDVLYIPAGYWHMARALPNVPSFHLAVGASTSTICP